MPSRSTCDIYLRQSRGDLREHYHAKAKAASEQNRKAREAYRQGVAEPHVACESREPVELPSPSCLAFCWTLGEKLVCEQAIGGGTYGTVYRARFAGTFCAIKVPRKARQDTQAGEIDGSPGALQDIAREFAILNQLAGHIGVVRSYLVATSSSGVCGLIMELASGSFESWSRRMRDTAEPLWPPIVQILHGLAYTHEKQILHADVKASNILCFHGRVALADFGLARALTANRVTLTGNSAYSEGYRCIECMHAKDSKAVHFMSPTFSFSSLFPKNEFVVNLMLVFPNRIDMSMVLRRWRSLLATLLTCGRWA